MQGVTAAAAGAGRHGAARAAAAVDRTSAPGFIAAHPVDPTIDPEAPIPVPERVRLVGTDLDGTLLAPDLSVGPRARAAIPALAGRGIDLVYVTGRPPRWLTPIVAQTGHTGMAICANGAVIVDLAAQRLVRHTPIDPDLAAEVAGRLRELVPGITFAVERMLQGAARAHGLAALSVVGFEPGYDPPWARPADLEVAPIGQLLARGPVVKLLALPPADAGHDADSLVALAESEFADALHITHSGALAMLIEIMARGADKGAAFVEVAGLLEAEVTATIGVGDMPNDVTLIRAAGTGYAVANAHPAARAAADHVIPSNADDGVGRLLEALLAVPS